MRIGRAALVLLVALGGRTRADESLEAEFRTVVRPFLVKYCLDCHGAERPEGEIDLAAFGTTESIRRSPRVWQRVRAILDSEQMPPREADQPSDDERLAMRSWVRSFLLREAEARAGDPGPVVLRRLSNAEYTYTIRDLTGVAGLEPTREFPVDGAAGEGFTNTGDALGMSPALVTKYLDAAKGVAAHAVLLPDGIRFTPETTRRDRTDASIAAIRSFYAQHAVPLQSREIRLHGLVWDSADGGGLPLDRYLLATIEERETLAEDPEAVARVARERGLSPRYLGLLWRSLVDRGESIALDDVRARWRTAKPADVPRLVDRIRDWQQVLWRFASVGEVTKDGSETRWQVPVNPVVARREFDVALPVSAEGDLVLGLAADDGGDGAQGDVVAWRNPRLVAEGLPDLSLAEVAGLSAQMTLVRREMLAKTHRYLAAASELDDRTSLGLLAEKHDVDATLLGVWLEALELEAAEPVEITGRFEAKLSKSGNYDFVRGWGRPQTPNLVANSSDDEVRIPGIARPHGVVAHPSPTEFVAAEWRSPIAGEIRVEARIADAHPECGNGVEWFVRNRTATGTVTLAKGEFDRAGKATMPARTVVVHEGDTVSLVLGPRDGNHSCDLTAIDLVLAETGGENRTWDLSKDVSDDVLAGNPHADRHGNAGVWHFTSGPMTSLAETSDDGRPAVPAGSLLARWRTERDPEKRRDLAAAVQRVATADRPEVESPERALYDFLQAFPVPLDHPDVRRDLKRDARFGKRPNGAAATAVDLVVHAPRTETFRIPADLARGRRFVATVELEPTLGRDGSVRVHVSTDNESGELDPATPILVSESGNGRPRVVAALDEFRDLFPAALCYTRIVPVDSVVTLVLFHREDEPLRRLLLDDDQRAEIDQLWDEMLYVAREPLAFEVAYEQIREFATQDNPAAVKALAPMEPSVRRRAEAFRARLRASEPRHVESLLEIAEHAWRRPLTDPERTRLRRLYDAFRETGIEHDEAIRLVLARVLTSPAFLYRLESPAPGPEAAPVGDHELASRLSYFLWSSLPDDELQRAAGEGRLTEDEAIVAHTRRMLADPRTERLAVQFACQWLHVRDFNSVEKNETLHPDFAELRADVREETVRFFSAMFRENGSILDLLDADHTYLNGPLARHYGIEGVEGPEWRRVDGLRNRGRGGVLGMASVLASQSGVSRTSPILRGNWVFETLLGERLPRPPANVPTLPESVPAGLSARQLIERHSADPACAKCHARIDPYGFALERFDTVGRLRPDAVDTRTTLPDGSEIDGLAGLREYLLTKRRDAVVHQFCRKLLGFALGREVQLSDEPLLAEMARRLAANEYRFHVAVEAIVTSRQFRDIR